MATLRKKDKHADKSKKKISDEAGKRRPKVKDEVCILEEVVMTESVCCCDDECCCVL